MALHSPQAAGLARFPHPRGERRFEHPIAIIEAMKRSEVLPALEQLEAETRAGHWAAGFLAYEAATALDSDLDTHTPAPGHPLLWFGIYDACQDKHPEPTPALPYALGAWQPLVDPAQYTADIARIRQWIAAGDSYQVNYTFPMHATFNGDPQTWFEDLRAAQRANHCAYIDTGRHAIVSASPELFFSLAGDRIRTRPMKGTRPRGRWTAEDRAHAEALKASPKERAENVMIVDLLRNDLGRLAHTGSVRVTSLFDLERYPTVWQLTSTIEADTKASWTEALAILFPSGSVTGAPKIRTMQLIRQTETHPRGVYCGAIGWAAPDGRAAFNVAIRTATVDRAMGHAAYHVGGGITWESTAETEYAECTHKARILTHRRPAFSLLETMRVENGACALLTRHLDRLEASADYFAIPFDRPHIHHTLEQAMARCPEPARLRLVLDPQGQPDCQTSPLPEPRTFLAAWSPEPVDDREVFLYHKTTHRECYERARASAPHCDDVLLINARGEVTEGCIGNVVIQRGARRFTPPIECGLLPGVFRQHLLDRGEIETAILTRDEVRQADARWLINALRGWIPLELLE